VCIIFVYAYMCMVCDVFMHVCVCMNREALEQTDEASTDIIASGPTTQLDKLLAYMNRPVELEDLSMMQFEQDYKYYKDTKQNRYFF
jgi:hypothetical protein